MIDVEKKYRALKVELAYVVDESGWKIGYYEHNDDGTVTFYFEEFSGAAEKCFKKNGGRTASWNKLKDLVKEVEPTAVFDDSSFSARINE